jgi:hypothetical protein
MKSWTDQKQVSRVKKGDTIKLHEAEAARRQPSNLAALVSTPPARAPKPKPKPKPKPRRAVRTVNAREGTSNGVDIELQPQRLDLELAAKAPAAVEEVTLRGTDGVDGRSAHRGFDHGRRSLLRHHQRDDDDGADDDLQRASNHVQQHGKRPKQRPLARARSAAKATEHPSEQGIHRCLLNGHCTLDSMQPPTPKRPFTRRAVTMLRDPVAGASFLPGKARLCKLLWITCLSRRIIVLPTAIVLPAAIVPMFVSLSGWLLIVSAETFIDKLTYAMRALLLCCFR